MPRVHGLDAPAVVAASRGQRGAGPRTTTPAALGIRQRLAEAESDRADFQRDLSISFERLGTSCAEDGNVATAVQYLDHMGVGEPTATPSG